MVLWVSIYIACGWILIVTQDMAKLRGPKHRWYSGSSYDTFFGVGVLWKNDAIGWNVQRPGSPTVIFFILKEISFCSPYIQKKGFASVLDPHLNLTKRKPLILSSLRKPWHTRWLQRHQRGQRHWSSAVSWLARTSSSSRMTVLSTDQTTRTSGLGKRLHKSYAQELFLRYPQYFSNQRIRISRKDKNCFSHILFFIKNPLKDISANYTWMRCWCEDFPDRIPSGFFVTDTFLVFDYFMGNCLLLNSDHVKKATTYEDKIDIAREEANKLKRLMSSLRYLWRNGPSNMIQHLLIGPR